LWGLGGGTVFRRGRQPRVRVMLFLDARGGWVMRVVGDERTELFGSAGW